MSHFITRPEQRNNEQQQQQQHTATTATDPIKVQASFIMHRGAARVLFPPMSSGSRMDNELHTWQRQERMRRWHRCFPILSTSCRTRGIQRWVKQSPNTVGFFRLLTSYSLAIKSISHCQCSWGGLHLNEGVKMLLLLLPWDLNTVGTWTSILFIVVTTDAADHVEIPVVVELD